MKKNFLKFLIAGLIILALVGFFVFKPKNNAQKLEFTTIKRQDIRSTVSSSGSLSGKNTANLKFKSAGKLAYLNIKEGDKVFAGQVIAGLDTQTLSIALQQAQNTFVSKDAAAKKAEDDVKNHDKDETFAQKETRISTQVARDNAYDSVKEAQRAFGDAVIASPISGLVTQADSLPGQNVSTTDIIAQIVDTSEIIFDTDVDEADIGKISQGLPAEITLDAYGDKIFKGQVNQILPQTKTTASGATVVTVKIKLSDPPQNFVDGLTGQAIIILEEVKNALTIPVDALREDGSVFTQNNQNIKVKTGIRSDTDVEIKEGLEEKEKVLLNPPAKK
ncbi:efflux RND transporter periplasmic adaptor subunit [Candidatus Daviesbacteria bacterium]|nr:efflux RND transporter periplasmic adaptor subunit [Candidatus Daviesbacteria bacterium]